MAVTATWLVDTSALARLAKPPVAAVLKPRIAAGRVAVCVVTELEVGFSARSVSDHDAQQALLRRLVPAPITAEAERLARETQRHLVEHGHHRAVAVPDLLVAAVASTAGLTVLYYDGDFDLVSEVLAVEVEWVVPAGTAD